MGRVGQAVRRRAEREKGEEEVIGSFADSERGKLHTERSWWSAVRGTI
jgi:hypothetical protein